MKSSTHIVVSNTTQSTISLNCSFIGKDEKMVPIYHDIQPARVCICAKIPREDWDRVKDTPAVIGMIESGALLPEKKKVTIDQETDKVSDPQPEGELAESAKILKKDGEKAVNRVGTREGETKLKRK
jgi:hypothetical protein